MALLAGTALALVLAAVGGIYWQSSPAQVFAEARAYWQENPVPRYRLVIERPMLNCQQDVIVEHEQIVPDTGQNSCPIETLTMTGLFDRVARLDGEEHIEFFSSGRCVCQSVLRATVFYDQELGYPSEIGIADQRVFDWDNSACWQHMLLHGKLPDCNARFLFPQPRITNVSLTPLP
jgi:hypothetical protein